MKRTKLSKTVIDDPATVRTYRGALVGDTFNTSHFSQMKLKALLGAVVASAAGLVFALPAEAGYSCRPNLYGEGMNCSGTNSSGDPVSYTVRPSLFGDGYQTRGTIGGSSFSETCRSNLFGEGFNCD